MGFSRGAQSTTPVGRAGEVGRLDATAPGGIDLYVERRDLRVDGRVAPAITLNGSFPGPVIHMTEGRVAEVRVHNLLDESTSVHWHGVLVPFTMDGVPDISFAGIAPGESFTYRFPIRQNGSYWYHSHSGLQEPLGHYGALVLEPAPPDPVEYDASHSLVLSDWSFEDPHVIARNLKVIEGYYNFQRPTVANLPDVTADGGEALWRAIRKRLRWQWMRMDPTDLADVTAATFTYLINGRSPRENWTGIARRGERTRLRIVNASTMTFFDFRIDGLPMTVVQADGQNVEPVETDEIRIGVAETYDVIVTIPDDRPYTIFAETMDRSGYARGTLGPPGVGPADVPARRARPMLTMADMGMMPATHDGAGSMDHGVHSDAGASHEGMGGGMQPGRVHAAETRRGPHSPVPHRRPLPTEGLPDRQMHGPDTHGPASLTMAHSAYRQLEDPGIGLGDDGRRVLSYGQLRCLETPADRRPPTREFDLHLTGNMHRYVWGFDGKKWSEADMIRFEYGERLRIHLVNDTMMSHPIHLHGMWMDLYTGGDYAKGPRKHTVNVQPAELLTVDISADAPGQWAFHCHLLYHMEMGMFRTVTVVRSLAGGGGRAER